jgi:SAM-dependent MidA family methyltransferase
VEWGGGTGQLAKQFLDAVQEADEALYQRLRYTSIEHSEYHRHLQAENGEAHLSHIRWMQEQTWLEELESRKQPVVVFSNELIDAFPVKRAVYRQEGWMELYVTWDESNEQWMEVEREPSSELQIYLDGVTLNAAEGQRIEVNLQGIEWYDRTARALPVGSLLVTIDYGHLAKDLWSPERMKGTLMCYYQHQGHDDPYRHIGDQDITAHVNFTDMIKTGEAAQMKSLHYFTQKEFLLNAGILERLQNHAWSDPFHPVARKNRAIRQLLLSDGMSELFKVLIQQKKGD